MKQIKTILGYIFQPKVIVFALLHTILFLSGFLILYVETTAVLLLLGISIGIT